MHFIVIFPGDMVKIKCQPSFEQIRTAPEVYL